MTRQPIVIFTKWIDSRPVRQAPYLNSFQRPIVVPNYTL
jgi:hypothetical protein